MTYQRNSFRSKTKKTREGIFLFLKLFLHHTQLKSTGGLLSNETGFHVDHKEMSNRFFQPFKYSDFASTDKAPLKLNYKQLTYGIREPVSPINLHLPKESLKRK